MGVMWHPAPMADGTPDDGPSLEMPSFSLRRKKKDAERADEVPEPVPSPEPAPRPVEPQRRRARRPIAIAGLPAAAVTGVVVGALAVLLAWLAGVGCSAVRGTSSCGGPIGLPVLVVGLVLLAWAGSRLLCALGVADAGSTSLLAVGILTVLVMLFLLGSLDEWWTAIAIPVLAVMTYVASWWVTTSVVGEDSEAPTPESYDVR